MFEQTFIQNQAQTRKPWTVAVSLSVQCLAVAILLLLPLLHTETLGLINPSQPRIIRTWINQPPLPPLKTAPQSTTVSVPFAPRPVFLIPSAHPAAVRSIDVPSSDSEPDTWSGSVGGTFASPVFIDALPSRRDVQKPAIPPETRPVASGPVRVGSGVEGAKLVFGPHPAYPAIAKAARSQGTVKLEATIAADGSIRNLRVVSGPPLLVNAALDAVRQWRYQATLLNGIAVEVLTEIDVNFSLAN